MAELSFENIAEAISSTSFADLLSKLKVDLQFSDNTIEVCGKLYLKPIPYFLATAGIVDLIASMNLLGTTNELNLIHWRNNHTESNFLHIALCQ